MTVTVKEGQIWRENDKRAMGRTVKVVSVGMSSATIQSIDPKTGLPMKKLRRNPRANRGGKLHIVGECPVTKTNLSRFGASGAIGFTLVKDV